MSILLQAMTALSSDGAIISTITIGNSGVFYGYSDTGTPHGGISGTTNIGGDNIRTVRSYDVTAKTTTYYVEITINGNHTGTPNWTSIEFLDVSGSPTLSEASVTPSYDSGNNYTSWVFSTTTASGNIFDIWNAWEGSSATEDVEWTLP